MCCSDLSCAVMSSHVLSCPVMSCADKDKFHLYSGAMCPLEASDVRPAAKESMVARVSDTSSSCPPPVTPVTHTCHVISSMWIVA